MLDRPLRPTSAPGTGASGPERLDHPVAEPLCYLPLAWAHVFRLTDDAAVSDRVAGDVVAGLRRASGTDCGQVIDLVERRALERMVRVVQAPASTASPRPEVYECAEGVERMLARVDPSVRDAILLVYVGGRSYRQVARDLATSDCDIRDRIDRALAHLASVAPAQPG